jgi:hypothetical protein
MQSLSKDPDKTLRELATQLENGKLPSYIEKGSEFHRLIEAYAGELREKAKTACNTSLINLGKKKIEILNNSITRFLASFDNLQTDCIKSNNKISSFTANFPDKKTLGIDRHKRAEDLIAEATSGEYDLICKQAHRFKQALVKLNQSFLPLIRTMESIIQEKGGNLSTYTPEEKETVLSAISCADTLGKALNTPLLKENGGISEESKQIIVEIISKYDTL